MGATGWGQDPGSRQDLGDQLMRLVRLVERAGTRLKGGDDGVDRASYLLLVHLVRQGPRRLTTLAEAVHSDPSTVSRQVAALVRNGLVERLADPDDGRASLLAATPTGQRVHADNRRLRDAFVARPAATDPDPAPPAPTTPTAPTAPTAPPAPPRGDAR